MQGLLYSEFVDLLAYETKHLAGLWLFYKVACFTFTHVAMIFLAFQMAVQEKYKLCYDNLTKLLLWIAQIEKTLAEQSPVREDISELQEQINNLKVWVLILKYLHLICQVLIISNVVEYQRRS